MTIATATSADFIDMGQLNLFYVGYGVVTNSTASQIQVQFSAGYADLLTGAFTYAASGQVQGTLTGFKEYYTGVVAFDVSGFSVSLPDLVTQINAGDYEGVMNTIFGANDQITGSVAGDYLIGLAGNDLIDGGDGTDSIDGGTGDDNIRGGAGADFIRGLENNDTIDGGAGDDDVNGNMGVDLVQGGDGADSVRGGQGNDQVYGGAGDDPHVNGNIGDDGVFGGTGNDTIYGGQGSDTLSGEDGNDWLSGDLGNDSLVGGAGADRFLFRAGSGVDVVGDFSFAAGDRVQLAPGTAYSLSLSGANAVIALSASDQIILTGTGAASADWVVFA